MKPGVPSQPRAWSLLSTLAPLLPGSQGEPACWKGCHGRAGLPLQGLLRSSGDSSICSVTSRNGSRVLWSWTVHLRSLKAECRGELEAPVPAGAPPCDLIHGRPPPTEAATWCWLPTRQGRLVEGQSRGAEAKEAGTGARGHGVRPGACRARSRAEGKEAGGLPGVATRARRRA